MSLDYLTRAVKMGQRSRRRMRKHGQNMKGDRLWSREEEAVLIAHQGEYELMSKLLPHRSRAAIASRCQLLGLRRKIHVWTAAELAKLRRLYPVASVQEIEEAFPHSSWTNICQVARYHGFCRAVRSTYKSTGHPALDDVRQRCLEIRWTMKDLDKAARTGCYFQRAGWIGKKINYRALGRAIEALDGVIECRWKE